MYELNKVNINLAKKPSIPKIITDYFMSFYDSSIVNHDIPERYQSNIFNESNCFFLNRWTIYRSRQNKWNTYVNVCLEKDLPKCWRNAVPKLASLRTKWFETNKSSSKILEKIGKEQYIPNIVLTKCIVCFMKSYVSNKSLIVSLNSNYLYKCTPRLFYEPLLFLIYTIYWIQ